MDNESEKSLLKKVKENYYISYKLLKENWTPFAKTELFLLTVMGLILISIAIVSALFRMYHIKVFASAKPLHLFFYFSLIVVVNIFFLTFLTSQFGLANDIFYSGHMFTEFSSSFTYYKKHWKVYTLITIIIYWSQFLADPLTILPIASLISRLRVFPIDLTSINEFVDQINFLKIFLRQFMLSLVQLASIIILIGILPSITIKKNFKQALKENFRYLRGNSLLIIITWMIYYLLFILPNIAINLLLLLILKNNFIYQNLFLLGIVHVILNVAFIFVSMPFMSLLATRLHIIGNNKISNPN